MRRVRWAFTITYKKFPIWSYKMQLLQLPQILLWLPCYLLPIWKNPHFYSLPQLIFQKVHFSTKKIFPFLSQYTSDFVRVAWNVSHSRILLRGKTAFPFDRTGKSLKHLIERVSQKQATTSCAFKSRDFDFPVIFRNSSKFWKNFKSC